MMLSLIVFTDTSIPRTGFTVINPKLFLCFAVKVCKERNRDVRSTPDFNAR